MNPPSGGPITGPTSAGTVTQAIAFTSALLSIERSSTSRPTGVIIAPPKPCTMRAITKWVTVEDSAQPIEPTMKTAMAIENTIRAPKRSAVQPLAGMNTASDSRYEVMASFSVSGLAPISAAIAGSEVAITVESMFSMNRAVATMSGIRRSLFIENRGDRREEGCNTAGTVRLLRNPGNHLNPASHRRRRSCHDLCPVSLAAAAWAARERAAVFGDLQPVPDRLLRDFRAVFSRPAAGAVGARADRRSHKTGRAHAPAGGGGDPPVRPATGLSSLNACGNRAVRADAGVTAGRLTKSLCMAGKRFDSAARHAIDHRQPYRWASIRRRCKVHRRRTCSSPRSYRGERAAEWSW